MRYCAICQRLTLSVGLCIDCRSDILSEPQIKTDYYENHRGMRTSFHVEDDPIGEREKVCLGLQYDEVTIHKLGNNWLNKNLLVDGRTYLMAKTCLRNYIPLNKIDYPLAGGKRGGVMSDEVKNLKLLRKPPLVFHPNPSSDMRDIMTDEDYDWLKDTIVRDHIDAINGENNLIFEILKKKHKNRKRPLLYRMFPKISWHKILKRLGMPL